MVSIHTLSISNVLLSETAYEFFSPGDRPDAGQQPRARRRLGNEAQGSRRAAGRLTWNIIRRVHRLVGPLGKRNDIMSLTRRCLELLFLLLQHGGNPNHFNSYGMPLLITATRGDGSEKIKLLLRYGANIEIMDKSKRHTPLTAAATFGTPATIKTLLENGADPNHVPSESSALFMLSINKQCDMSCVELLLRYGADPDLPVGKRGLTYRQSVERYREQPLIDLINRYFPLKKK